MKKILLIILIASILGAYALFISQQSQGNQISSNPFYASGNNTQASNSISQASKSYKDGVYTGNAVANFYGNVQVRATISGGKITSIDFLDYPKDRMNSMMISRYSTPILSQEAIRTQSANVDIVSGATQTSEAFIQSLQSALDRAS